MRRTTLSVVWRRSAFGLALSGAAFAFPACSSTPEEETTDTGSEESAITVSDIMARANEYLAAKVLYCQAPAGQVYEGPESCYGSTPCPAPKGHPWDDYRTDCSGFVSYVWQIPSDPDTGTYTYDQSGSQGWTTIPIDSLRAGDALVTDGQGHIKLFSSFDGSNAAIIYEEFDCNQIARKARQGFSRAGNHIYFDGDDRSYHAIRRNALKPSPPPPPPPHPTPKPTPPSGCGEIQDGRGLAPGRAIRSCDGRFELVMQGDGDLVEYGPVGAMWSTHSAGSGGYAADMRTDGDFVLYGKNSNPLWSNGTHSAGAALMLQNDGNIVVRARTGAALWATNTVFAQNVPTATGCGAIHPGFGLNAGQTLRSCDKRFALAMQTDGNLVWYEGSRALWSSKTNGKKGYKAQMQGDGNFVVYDWHNRPLWSSDTAGHPGSFFALQGDGNLVVYAPGSRPVWASNTVQ